MAKLYRYFIFYHFMAGPKNKPLWWSLGNTEMTLDKPIRRNPQNSNIPDRIIKGLELEVSERPITVIINNFILLDEWEVDDVTRA